MHNILSPLLSRIALLRERLNNIFPVTISDSDSNKKSIRLRRLIKGICYPIVFILAFCIFFIPTYLNSHVETLLPALLAQQDVAQVQLKNPAVTGFPPKLTAQTCRITPKRGGIPALSLTNLTISPSIGGLFLGRFGANFSAKGFGGTISGTLGTDSFSTSTARLQITGKNIAIAQLPKTTQFDKQLTGFSNFAFTVAASPDRLYEAEGSLQAQLHDVSVKNVVPVFTTPRISIKTANINCDFEGPRIALHTLTLQSNAIEGSLDGTLQLAQKNILQSKVSLRGHLLPNPKTTVLALLDTKAVGLIKQGKSVSVSISKTLGRPDIQLR